MSDKIYYVNSQLSQGLPYDVPAYRYFQTMATLISM